MLDFERPETAVGKMGENKRAEPRERTHLTHTPADQSGLGDPPSEL